MIVELNNSLFVIILLPHLREFWWISWKSGSDSDSRHINCLLWSIFLQNETKKRKLPENTSDITEMKVKYHRLKNLIFFI